MGEQLEQPAEEIKRLRRCISNLVSVLALSATWSNGGLSQIVSSLLDMLPGMLALDLVYVRLEDPIGDAPIEMAWVAQPLSLKIGAKNIGSLLDQCLGDDPQKWPPLAQNRFGDDDLSIVPLRLGLQGETGVIIVGSQRVDFPGQTDRLLLDVAVNQVAIGLQEARVRSEQKRVANELDRQVAQRTAELAMVNEELQLRVGLLQHIPVSAFTLRPDGTPDFVNEVWLEYAGQTLAYVQSYPEAWMDAVHPEDRESTAISFWDGVRSGQGFAMASRLRRARDGAYRWYLNRAVPLHNADGKILKFVGTSTDIEDLKQSQEDLRRSEEKHRLIIDTALDAVITIDTQGTITSWNKQAETIFGWTKQEAIGQRMSEMIIPKQLRIAHERGLRHFLATGDGPVLGRRIEVTAIRRSGVEFPVELEINPMRLGQNWVFSAFIRDITDSKLAEQKLRESELNLRQMSETIPEMLWSGTPEGAFDYCNGRLLDYTGSSAEEVMGSGWKKFIHQEDVDLAARTWMSCVKTGAPYRVEVRIFHASDHAYRWCVSNALPLLDQDGRILKWHGTVVDMHDWKQAQEELRKAQVNLAHITRLTTVGELTASIAHEVNQPLAAVVTNANACLRWLDHEPPNFEEVRVAIRAIIRDGNRGGDVIKRIRGLVRKEPAPRAFLDVNEIIRETIALMQADLQGMALRTELAGDLPHVRADRIQLQQVLLNLAMNAMDAMKQIKDRPHVLFIQTQCRERCMLVAVQDTGIGLNPNEMEKLFETFYTTKPDGLGMGLSICRSIIEGHGGRLWAECNEGPGTTFQFTLPIPNLASG